MDLSFKPELFRGLESVPAHAGGVDLSIYEYDLGTSYTVPAHAGGVDLSSTTPLPERWSFSPRPCGRGGFKPVLDVVLGFDLCPRPCGRGGFKLVSRLQELQNEAVPAHAGGVDLS